MYIEWTAEAEASIDVASSLRPEDKQVNKDYFDERIREFMNKNIEFRTELAGGRLLTLTLCTPPLLGSPERVGENLELRFSAG